MIDDISKKAVEDFRAETENLQVSVNSLNKTLDDLQKKQREMTGDWRRYSSAFAEGEKNIESAKKQIADFTTQLSENSRVLNGAKGTLLQNKDVLAALETKYATLSRSQGDNAKEVKNLNVQIGHLTKTVDDQEKKLLKSREVFDYQKASIDALKSSFDSIKESNKDFGPVLDDAAKGFNAMKTGLGAVKTGFQSVGGAIKTTGFGALVLVLQSLVSYFTETTEGSAIMRGSIAAIGVVIDKVKQIFAGFGKTIVTAVLNPADTIKKVWNAVMDNIGNRFKGVTVFFDGLFSGNLKKMGDGVIQISTGITNATGKMATAFNYTKDIVIKTAKEIKTAYENGTKAVEENTEAALTQNNTLNNIHIQQIAIIDNKKKKLDELTEKTKDAQQAELDSIARMAKLKLEGYDLEISNAADHYNNLMGDYKNFIKTYEEADSAFQKKYLQQYNNSKKAVQQLTAEEAAALNAIAEKFKAEDLQKLDSYLKDINRLKAENIKEATDRDLALLKIETDAKVKELDEQAKKIADRKIANEEIVKKLSGTAKVDLKEKIEKDQQMLQAMANWKVQYLLQQSTKEKQITDAKEAEENNKKQQALTNDIATSEQNGHHSTALQQQIMLLDMQRQVTLNNTTLTEQQRLAIETDYKNKRAALEDELLSSRIHAGDKYIDFVLKNTKKDSAIYKAAFLAKKATAIADVIISTKKAIIASFEGYAHLPFIGQALAIAQGALIAGQGAASIAQIVKQKPGFAAGGQFTSDGRGALLPGYSRTDNTNAYLRSGEAVVVSEAMRNPWARNLVSAINVAHGGRDFSVSNAGRGYAIGGIFTDGGNAGRYYSQPVNDVKDLANTLAYQMINNFPPVYVDVKDINTQQSILARTVNRVNL